MYYFTVNRWQQQQCFLSNCYSRFFPVRLYSDFRVIDYQEKQNKTEQQRELIINKSLTVSLLSLSHWPQDEPTYTAFTMKRFFFFLAWCQKFLAVCGEIKWNAVNWICSCSTPRLPQPWSWWPEFDFCICQILKITDSYKENEKMRDAEQDSAQDISLQ